MIPKEAIEITILTLQSASQLHYKSCFEDITGRPDFNCNCTVKEIVDKLIKLKEIPK
jgi:hypothetical protein